MICRALVSALMTVGLLVGTVYAAPGRDPNSDQGTGYIENEYGVGTCDADATVYDDMPSSSDCGRVNADDYANQPAQGADD